MRRITWLPLQRSPPLVCTKKPASPLPAAPEAVRRPPADGGDDPRWGGEDRGHSRHSGPREDSDPAPESGSEVDWPARQSRGQVSLSLTSTLAANASSALSCSSWHLRMLLLIVDSWNRSVQPFYHFIYVVLCGAVLYLVSLQLVSSAMCTDSEELITQDVHVKS